jgi:hypothetical protein
MKIARSTAAVTRAGHRATSAPRSARSRVCGHAPEVVGLTFQRKRLVAN